MRHGEDVGGGFAGFAKGLDFQAAGAFGETMAGFVADEWAVEPCGRLRAEGAVE